MLEAVRFNNETPLLLRAFANTGVLMAAGSAHIFTHNNVNVRVTDLSFEWFSSDSALGHISVLLVGLGG